MYETCKEIINIIGFKGITKIRSVLTHWNNFTRKITIIAFNKELKYCSIRSYSTANAKVRVEHAQYTIR